MNGTEQRARQTALARVEERVNDVAVVVEELDSRLADLAKVVEALDRRQVEISQGTAEAYDALAARVDAFATMSLWQRVRWAVRRR